MVSTGRWLARSGDRPERKARSGDRPERGRPAETENDHPGADALARGRRPRPNSASSEIRQYSQHSSAAPGRPVQSFGSFLGCRLFQELPGFQLKHRDEVDGVDVRFVLAAFLLREAAVATLASEFVDPRLGLRVESEINELLGDLRGQ